MCTYENKPGSTKCFTCGTSRTKRKSTEPINFFSKRPRLAERVELGPRTTLTDTSNQKTGLHSLSGIFLFGYTTFKNSEPNIYPLFLLKHMINKI